MRASVTKIQRLGVLNRRAWFLKDSGGQRFKVKVSSDLVHSEGLS